MRGYKHESIHHGRGEYARGAIAKSILCYWSLFKRSVRGTHIHISGKHMRKYLAEFDFRRNARKMPKRMFSLLMELLRGARRV